MRLPVSSTLHPTCCLHNVFHPGLLGYCCLFHAHCTSKHTCVCQLHYLQANERAGRPEIISSCCLAHPLSGILRRSQGGSQVCLLALLSKCLIQTPAHTDFPFTALSSPLCWPKNLDSRAGLSHVMVQTAAAGMALPGSLLGTRCNWYAGWV